MLTNQKNNKISRFYQYNPNYYSKSSMMSLIQRFSCILLLQCLLQNMFLLDSVVEARMALMTRLKILALLTLAKKVDVVPFPLPIPIPIHLEGKDEYVYFDSLVHRPMPYLAPIAYMGPRHHHHHHYPGGYSASELQPIMVPPETNRPLRYGDRISSTSSLINGHKHSNDEQTIDPSSTYRIRKVHRHRQADPKIASLKPKISSNQKSTTTTARTTTSTTTTTTTPEPPTSTSSTTIASSPATSVNDNSNQYDDNENENVNLKDIKIIFIPVKNFNAIQNVNNEMESDMKKFGEEVSKYLKETNESSNESDGDASDSRHNYNNNNQSRSLYPSWNLIQNDPSSNQPKVLKNQYTVEQTVNLTTVNSNNATNSAVATKPESKKLNEASFSSKRIESSSTTMKPLASTESPPPTSKPKTDSGSNVFEIPSLQTKWEKENSYVPKASYYRAPELKVVHSRAQPYQPDYNSNNNQNEQQWSSMPDLTPPDLTPRPLPNLQPNHIQFLYSITHSNDAQPNLSNYPFQINQSPIQTFRQQYPTNFGLESFRQNQYRRQPLYLPSSQPSQNDHYHNQHNHNQNDELILQSSSMKPKWVRPIELTNQFNGKRQVSSIPML